MPSATAAPTITTITTSIAVSTATAATTDTNAAMSAQNPSPSTPVKVPAAAASYTPATLDPDLRSQINMVLIRDGHVAKIQDHLLHALNAHPANWPTAVQSHALSLLRSGEVSTFPALLKRVMDDIRHETALASPASASTIRAAAPASAATASTTNGTEAVNGAAAKPATTTVVVNGDAAGELAVPQAVVDEALRVTRESLEHVVEIEEGGGT